MQARIYQPAKSPTQSGNKKSIEWILEFYHDGSREIEPIMGWLSSKDMNQEIKLKFSSKEAAIRFADKHQMVYELVEPEVRRTIIKSYADNFTK